MKQAMHRLVCFVTTRCNPFDGDEYTDQLESQRQESAVRAGELRATRHSIILDNGLDYDTLNKRLYGRYPKERGDHA